MPKSGRTGGSSSSLPPDLGMAQLEVMQSRGGLLRACATGSYEVEVLGTTATEQVPSSSGACSHARAPWV